MSGFLPLGFDRRSHAEDFLQAESGNRNSGFYGIIRFAVLGTVGVVSKKTGGGRQYEYNPATINNDVPSKSGRLLCAAPFRS